MSAMTETYRQTEGLIIDLKGMIQALHDVSDNIPGLGTAHTSVAAFWSVLNAIEELAERIEGAHEAELDEGNLSDDEREFSKRLERLSREQTARFLEAAREEGLLGKSKVGEAQ